MNANPSQRLTGIGLQVLVVTGGIALMTAALLADQAWWDRHFLPLYFFSRADFVLGERLARLAGACIGILLILAGSPLRRMANRSTPAALGFGLLRLLLAAGLALALGERLLGHDYKFAAAETQPGEEPPRQPDARLGWVFTPSHDGKTIVGERMISYSTDALGYRVAGQNAPVDVAQPSILFTGESIVAGYGLNWDETIPARVGAALNTQSATLAVFGYANDQAYLRLMSELPRFRRPVAVISLFLPSLLARNLGDDRPHLGPGLRWLPAVHRLRLSALFRFLVPYHSEAKIEQGIQLTRDELLATADLARRRGAIPLVVDPQFGSETPVERMIRRRILEESGLAYVRVMLDPSWHLKGDLHPNARAADAIAMAIATRLRSELGRQAAWRKDGAAD